ncbi:hypothetical protein ACHAWT_008744, partial [Skeletonema menzelii]
APRSSQRPSITITQYTEASRGTSLRKWTAVVKERALTGHHAIIACAVDDESRVVTASYGTKGWTHQKMALCSHHRLLGK